MGALEGSSRVREYALSRCVKSSREEVAIEDRPWRSCCAHTSALAISNGGKWGMRSNYICSTSKRLCKKKQVSIIYEKQKRRFEEGEGKAECRGIFRGVKITD
jgi:hypothetical protein